MLGYSPEELGRMIFSELFVSRDIQRRFLSTWDPGRISGILNLFYHENRGAPLGQSLMERIDDTVVSCSVIDINAEKIAGDGG